MTNSLQAGYAPGMMDRCANCGRPYGAHSITEDLCPPRTLGTRFQPLPPETEPTFGISHEQAASCKVAAPRGLPPEKTPDPALDLGRDLGPDKPAGIYYPDARAALGALDGQEERAGHAAQGHAAQVQVLGSLSHIPQSRLSTRARVALTEIERASAELRRIEQELQRRLRAAEAREVMKR